MIRSFRFVVVLALVALIIGAYAVSAARQVIGGMFAPLPTVTSTQSGSNVRSPDLREGRLHYCDGSRSYALLSIPRDASFNMSIAVASPPIPAESALGTAVPVTGAGSISSASVVPSQPAGYLLTDTACAEVGIVNSRKLVLCSGPALSRFTITVSASGVAQAFVLALPACAAHDIDATPARQQNQRPVLMPRSTPVP